MAQQQMSVTMTGFAASHPSRNNSNPELVTFRMASTPSWNTDGKWKEGESLFINVQCWGKLGVNVLASVVKGAPLVIAGRMTCFHFKPDNARDNAKGEPHIEEVWRVRASNVGLDLSHSQSKWQRPAKAADAEDGGNDGDSTDHENHDGFDGNEVAAAASGDENALEPAGATAPF